MKKIVVMPVKNEEWILDFTLSAHSLWADHIIVADQNSTDRTPEICKKHPKVTYLQNKSLSFNEGERRQILLDQARNFEGKNLIFALDADEIITSQILDQNILSKVLNALSPGMSLELQWIQLWKNTNVYNTASPWGHNWKHFAYYDDRKTNFDTGKIHLPRVPTLTQKKTHRCEELKVLHFQFVNWERMLAKQRFYLTLEKTLNNHKNTLKLNYFYYSSKHSEENLQPVPSPWFKDYQEQNIKFLPEHPNNLYSYELETLKFFREQGLQKFKGLDIWDIDWEKKRLQSLRNPLNTNVVPIFEIKDPRNLFLKIYHRNFQRFIAFNGPLYRLIKPLVVLIKIFSKGKK